MRRRARGFEIFGVRLPSAVVKGFAPDVEQVTLAFLLDHVAESIQPPGVPNAAAWLRG